MQITSTNALLRGLSTCANFLRYQHRKPAIKGSALPPMTDHIARDIGLTPHEQALMAHHWPSRDTRHPFL